MKANVISLCFKIMGCGVILLTLFLSGFGLCSFAMSEVIAAVLAMQSLVLPIDIAKIKTARSAS